MHASQSPKIQTVENQDKTTLEFGKELCNILAEGGDKTQIMAQLSQHVEGKTEPKLQTKLNSKKKIVEEKHTTEGQLVTTRATSRARKKQ